MRKEAALFPLLLVVFFSTTGASIIDKETKRGVLGLDEKFERLAKQEESRHSEEVRLLKEQRELIQRLNQRIEVLEKQVKQASQAVKSLEEAPRASIQSTQPVSPPPTTPPPTIQPAPLVLPPPAVPIVSAPAASIQPASPLPVVQQVQPSPARENPPPQVLSLPREELPKPVEAPKQTTSAQEALQKKAPVVKTLPPPSLPKSPATAGKKSGRMEPMTVFALLLSGICVFLVIGLVVRLKKSEERFKKILWKSEMESLREEVVRGRPLLRILTEGDRVDLVNAGETTADEIKVSIGPAPAAMKQKIRTVQRLQAGERIELELQAQLSQDPLYSTLEYKNPNTGRIYKDQFVLKIDRLTGNPIPIQQAS